MRHPPIAERVLPPSTIDGFLRTRVEWVGTTDPELQWRTQAGPDTWTVRVNDFPANRLYTLLINGEELGSFDEWPREWSRISDGANALRLDPLRIGRKKRRRQNSL